MKIAILGSTRGTSFQAILDAYLPNIEICFVLSNKKDAYILERAEQHGISSIFLDPTGKTREEFDDCVTLLLERCQVDMVLLIGYMRLMSEKFVDRWLNKVVNIHPSLLPAFAGGMDRNVHDEVLKRGCKVSGASLIFIDHGADTGPIIMQRVCQVDDGETVDSLRNKVQRLEGQMLVDFLKQM